MWYMKTPEGQIYGPVAREQLDDWCDEGRITDDCQVREGVQAVWQSAHIISPSLITPRSRATASSAAYGQQYGPVHQAGGVQTGTSLRTGYAAGRSGYQQPHRGGLIITLAVLGWVSCPIFSVMAWSMGSDDLNKMRTGLMDGAGMGLTQAGQVMGMINSILYLVGLAGIVLMCLFLSVIDSL